jgi:hypothetical protein
VATTIEKSTAAYEDWLRTQLGEEVVQTDLDEKHAKMAEGTFPFLRATYWRWAETILDVCPELESAPAVLAVGDIHLENFGTWRDADGRLVWGVNDFDEAAEMPYALDLVRLATSAVLVDPPLASGTIICRDILAGYQEGLADPHAIVLDCDFAWLLDLVAVSEKKRAKFWREIETSETQKEFVPARYKRSLARAMPKHRLKKAEIAIRRRTAGVGSLGRPRWVGIAAWRGASVVREAKAAVPPAWTLPKGRASQASRCEDIATGRYRSPDPWYALKGKVIVRRLSPNNRKFDADDLHKLPSRKMLRLMGHELAAIHLGVVDHAKAIERDLAKREPYWLASAVKRSEEFVCGDQRKWKNRKARR